MGSRCARQCCGNPQLRKGGDARGNPPARGAHHQYCIRFRHARRRLARQHHLRRHQGERRGVDHGIGARARPARHYGQRGGAGRRRHGNDPCGADGRHAPAHRRAYPAWPARCPVGYRRPGDVSGFRSRRFHHRGGDPGRRRHPHHLTRRMEMQHLLVVGVVMLAGFMRGITGFGGAALMAPVLSAMLGPVQAVVTALTLETAAALIMFPDAWPRFNRRVLLYLTIPACVTVPIGGYLLVNVDAFIMRKVIAGVVVVFALALFSGLRYSRSPRPATSLALGSIVGVLLGATSVGAPPVILYLLASSDSHTVIRANLTVFVTAISVIGLIMLSAIGAITVPVAAYAGVAVIAFLVTTWLGGKLFGRVNRLVARRTALSLMLVMGVIALLV